MENHGMSTAARELPKMMPGHWDIPAWHEMASLYAQVTSRVIAELSDLPLANAVFLASLYDLDLIVWQTAAKEQIRWLSAQLARVAA